MATHVHLHIEAVAWSSTCNKKKNCCEKTTKFFMWTWEIFKYTYQMRIKIWYKGRKKKHECIASNIRLVSKKFDIQIGMDSPKKLEFDIRV
jgi:hypothetical protein